MSRYTFDQRSDGAFDLSISNEANPPGVPPPPPGVPPPPAPTPPPPGVPPSPPSGSVTVLSATQWKPGVGQPDVTFGRVENGAPANTYCQLITTGAYGVGPFRVAVPMTVLPGATTAGGNVGVISFVEAPGEHNASARLSISADQNPGTYIPGASDSAGTSVVYGEDRGGTVRLPEGVSYAVFEWSGQAGTSSNKVLEFSRFS